MRYAVVVILALLVLILPAFASPTRLDDLSTRDDVLKWIDGYRFHPDPGGLPATVRALSQRGAFRDLESSGIYIGFIAGVIGGNPQRADDLVAKSIPAVRTEEQWVIVRAIAYSGLPNWQVLLHKFGRRLAARQVMIDKYLVGTMPTLWQIRLEKSPSFMQKLKSYFSIDGFSSKSQRAAPDATTELSPELLDTFWGYYYATGSFRPLSRILAMLPWSEDRNHADRLTLGSMAKYTLATNAARDAALLSRLKQAGKDQPKEVAKVLNEVIEAAETIDTARMHKDALASIEDFKRRGPAYKRQISFWSKVGQGALALGCIVAAATGQIELGLPCVIGGGVSAAAINYMDQQQ